VRGIECAFRGTLGGDPERKTAKSGNAFAVMNVAVTVGKDDAGKDTTQWVRVACFGKVAEDIAARAAKSDRVYCEGTLTLNQWNDAHGEVRHGLNVAAWKVEKVAAIGKNRQFREKGHELAPSSFKADARRDAEAAFKPKPTGNAPRREFSDDLPF
jgi:single-strand DNA-binding protein